MNSEIVSQCCLRCIARKAAGGHAADASRADIQTVLVEQGTITADYSEPPTCTICMGILQWDRDAPPSELVDVFLNKESGVASYEGDAMSINVSLPVNLYIREMIAASTETIGWPFTRDAKDVYRDLVTAWIETTDLKLTIEMENVHVDVFLYFDHPDHTREASVLPIPIAKPKRSKRKRSDAAPATACSRPEPPAALKGLPAASRITECLSGKSFEELSKMGIDLFCPVTPATPSFEIVSQAVYIQGRYLKLVRGLSQTPWVLEGVRKGESSVEELISVHVVEQLQTEHYKFHTAGREDVDVRMLGNGRPFVVECLNPKKRTIHDYQELTDRINVPDGDVEVREMRPANKDTMVEIQAGADSKRKEYCCVVWAKEPVSDEQLAKLAFIEHLKVSQLTPLRVLHRRSLLDRPKVIHNLRAQRINQRFFLLWLQTSAGTYVKEFVHGDLGRTTPSLGEMLGQDVDIMQLDVVNLLMEDAADAGDDSDVGE